MTARNSAAFTLCTLAVLLGACATSVGDGAGPKTVGPVADAPLQVGTWAPLVVDTPPWVFPMVYHIDTIPPMPVDEYAMKFVETIKSFPADRPVWIQSHRWFGNYRPQDPLNVFSYAGDATPQATPGIWPRQGKAYWLSRHRRFLAILKEHGSRLDMWPLDHETYLNEWALCWAYDNTFRNIVNDPRWKTEPLYGLGLTGAELLDPAELEREEGPPWERTFRGRAFEGRKIRDSRLAYDAVKVAALPMNATVLNEVFAQPIFDAYPHAIVSDYGSRRMRRPISPQDPFMGVHPGQERFWERLRELRPEFTELPGVGNAAAPPLYHTRGFRNRNPDDPSRVGGMLYTVDAVIERYGGDPEKITPWITLPNYNPYNDEILPIEEYERFLVGLAERGVRRLILWFDPASMNTPEGGRAFVEAIGKANEAAERRRAR